MNLLLTQTMHSLYNIILPDGMRQALKSILPRSSRYWPKIITDFSEDMVIVIAPHMDDEILGCGGALRKHVLSGAYITVVYMTDGRRGGDREFYRYESRQESIKNFQSVLVKERKKEARRAAEIIGIQEQIFLDHCDGCLQVSYRTIEQLRTVLLEKKPTVIYLPSILDIHPDHRATNKILYAAIKNSYGAKDIFPICREYEVWTPLLANRIIDISDVVDTKHKAIEQFSSQMAQANYLRAQLALNAYRSLYHSQGLGYAEAFFESRTEEHGSLVRRFMV